MQSIGRARNVVQRFEGVIRQRPPLAFGQRYQPRGHRPTVDEGIARLELLRAKGPAPEAFTFAKAFPAPDAAEAKALYAPAAQTAYGAETPATRRFTPVGENLDQEALVRILLEPKNALVKQYRKFFEFENVELEFTEDALTAVADQALLRGTGARGLRAILEEVLLNVMYDLPSRTDVAKCVIDREVVLDKVNPTLVPKAASTSPTSSRPRRAAS